jgi:type III secretion protein J
MTKKFFTIFTFICSIILLTSCSENQSIVNNIDERDANEIVVFLNSKGIQAQKVQAATAETAGGGTTILWNIHVTPEKSVEAMAYLNQNGLPRKKGTNLLELFAKQGLMTSDKEENIRYQRGLEEELTNIIRKIDGVLDASVQISFPNTEDLLPGQEKKPIKAAVYVKHQGILDDPNHHLETKIKRLVAGSIDGLDFDNVSVVTDKARFANIQIPESKEPIYGKAKEKEYVSIWSIVMTKSSLARFRFIFFFFIIALVGAVGVAGYLIYKFYPHLRKKNKEDDNKGNE